MSKATPSGRRVGGTVNFYDEGGGLLRSVSLGAADAA